MTIHRRIVVTIWVSAALLAVQQACADDGIAVKGPYNQPYSPRILGPQYQPPIAAADQAPPALQVALDGATNELIVMLSTEEGNISSLLLPVTTNELSPTAIERATLESVRRQTGGTLQVLGNPMHARFLVGPERMSDSDRAVEAFRNSPRERLERYLVLSYKSVSAAEEAQRKMEASAAIAFVSNNRLAISSLTPNDSYFSSGFVVGPSDGNLTSQWGLRAMSFPQAWDKVRGHAQIGLLEPGYPGTFNPGFIAHPELAKNLRIQFMIGVPVDTSNSNQRIQNAHAVHVAGIIAAESNNGFATAGACIDCSVTLFSAGNNTVLSPSGFTAAGVTNALRMAVDIGMQVVNWSGSSDAQNATCAQFSSICDVLQYAADRQVLIVEAIGNFRQQQQRFPLNLAEQYSILKAAGTSIAIPAPGVQGSLWMYDAVNGSINAGIDGVLAPAKSVVSLMNAGSFLGTEPYILCGDTAASDESGTRFFNGYGDGVGSCTGTSMAAPHLSALAGLARSVNPRLTAIELRQLIRQSGNLASQVTSELGYGMPNALVAVNAATATNPSRLAPLFSFYSPTRNDSFYTTSPQMANAALDGALMPRQVFAGTVSNSSYGVYGSSYGTGISGYTVFPSRSPFVIGGSLPQSPLAQVWVFTTHVNPRSAAVPLVPLYRMSWKCGDLTPFSPMVCSFLPNHIDTVMVNEEEIGYFVSLGYKKDGVEGYVYPKTFPQPAGTVKLMRKYNASRDDNAVFPESALATMTNQGYNEMSNSSDWLGYVYPNTNGQTPVIQ